MVLGTHVEFLPGDLPDYADLRILCISWNKYACLQNIYYTPAKKCSSNINVFIFMVYNIDEAMVTHVTSQRRVIYTVR